MYSIKHKIHGYFIKGFIRSHVYLSNFRIKLGAKVRTNSLTKNSFENFQYLFNLLELLLESFFSIEAIRDRFQIVYLFCL